MERDVVGAGRRGRIVGEPEEVRRARQGGDATVHERLQSAPRKAAAAQQPACLGKERQQLAEQRLGALGGNLGGARLGRRRLGRRRLVALGLGALRRRLGR
ncbi:MAG: hypothetical protein DME02_02430 [Candidatus Rokuibacteriota bacterium]|nr:MAG: hypothetical protein DME02_02430 [Candidatus Rokubacteria bacterium]